MRRWNNRTRTNPLPLLLLLFAATVAIPAAPAQQSKPGQPAAAKEKDPVRSPDALTTAPVAAKPVDPTPSGGYVLRSDVQEVILSASVFSGTHLVDDLKKEDFHILEDGVPQTILGFQHQDLPVSISFVVDNSGSMFKKRQPVNHAALDLIQASNPGDEACVVNFNDEAYLDQDFTSDIAKLRDGLSHIESKGGTALYDAVVASADKLSADAKHAKQVIVLITDGEDNASSPDLGLEQTIRRVQQLSGPVIYSIGLLFGDDMSRSEAHHARRALELLSQETGGQAYFPKSLEQVDEIAAEVAHDIRSQYTIGYHSTKPLTQPGFRKVEATASKRGEGKLTVRTRTGYYPTVHQGNKNSSAIPSGKAEAPQPDHRPAD